MELGIRKEKIVKDEGAKLTPIDCRHRHGESSYFDNHLTL